MNYRMQIVEYSGELWQDEEPYPALLDLLTNKDVLIEVIHGEPPYQVVIGVPHQAAVDVSQIAEEWWDPSRKRYGRDSDEATALLALAAFTSLRDQSVPCKLVIAAHATDHDPNKELGSPYCQCVFSDPARLLFECHGAGKDHPNDVELSAGSNSLSRPAFFGRLLAQALAWRYRVAAQTQPGAKEAVVFLDERTEEQGNLRLPALNTDSLRQAGTKQMHALHLEAKPAFRISEEKPNALTEDGKALGWAVASAIMSYLNVI